MYNNCVQGRVLPPTQIRKSYFNQPELDILVLIIPKFSEYCCRWKTMHFNTNEDNHYTYFKPKKWKLIRILMQVAYKIVYYHLVNVTFLFYV